MQSILEDTKKQKTKSLTTKKLLNGTIKTQDFSDLQNKNLAALQAC
jgi:hypothetical protein